MFPVNQVLLPPLSIGCDGKKQNRELVFQILNFHPLERNWCDGESYLSPVILLSEFDVVTARDFWSSSLGRRIDVFLSVGRQVQTDIWQKGWGGDCGRP